MTDVVAVINPISGGGVGTERWAQVARRLRRAGLAVDAVESTSAEHATRAAADAAVSGATVVAVGGDGQIRQVAAGVLQVPGAPLGIVAAGRGNDLVHHLGLPTDVDGAAAVIAAGQRRNLDVLTIGEKVAIGNVYVGLDSMSADLINRLRWMGTLAYRVAPALAALRWRPRLFTVTVDGAEQTLRAHMVVIANSGWYGHGLNIVPSAAADDGRIDVLTVQAQGSTVRLIGAMGEAKTGKHIARPEVSVRTGTSVTVRADRPVPVHADGDYLQELPVQVCIRAGVLPVAVRGIS